MKTGLGLSAMLVSRGLSAVGGIVFSIAVARTGAADALGQTAIFLGLIGIGSIVAKRGMDTLLLKAVAQRDTGKSRRDLIPYLFDVMKRSALPSGLVACGVAAILATGIFGEIQGGAGVSAALIPVAVGLAHVAAYVKGTGRAWIAPIFEIGGISLLATVILLLFPVMPIAALLWGAVCVAAIAAALIRRDLTRSGSEPVPVGAIDWRQGRIDFTIIALATFLVSAGSFVLGGLFLDAQTLGLLRAAERLALIVSFPVLAIEPFISARIVRARHDDNIGQLRKTVTLAVVAGAALGIGPAVVLLVAPQWCLSLMGPGFDGAAGYLRTLAGLHLFVVVFSPFVTVLNLAGTERQAMKINIGVLILGVTLFTVLTIAFGAVGFLVAYCMVMLIKLCLSTWRAQRVLRHA